MNLISLYSIELNVNKLLIKVGKFTSMLNAKGEYEKWQINNDLMMKWKNGESATVGK